MISLIERANIALDVARAGRQKFAVFDEALYGDPAANLSLMSEMRQSIAAGHMLLHHQPKYDLRLGAVTGVEALVRWRHPTRGLVPPDAFIGMAEDTGHIRPLTDWVIDQAVADQRTFKDNGLELEVAINISGRFARRRRLRHRFRRRQARGRRPRPTSAPRDRRDGGLRQS